MTKADLVERVATQVNLTKKDTEVVIDTIFESISQALAAKADAKVELRGFGSFRVRRRRARQGRNPQTGRPVQVPAKRVPYFKPGKELKALVDS
jgi:integration host factor subunit beta